MNTPGLKKDSQINFNHNVINPNKYTKNEEILT